MTNNLLQAEVLAQHYSKFHVTERILLSGHSHQAWPDVSFEAQKQAWLDASEYVDSKWEQILPLMESVQTGFAELMNDQSGTYTLATNTHELLVRFLSALPLIKKRKLITTNAEFYSAARQLARLNETQLIEVLFIDAFPLESLTERIVAAIDDQTAAVIVSKVFFESGRILKNIKPIAEATSKFGAELLLDIYHALNIVPMDIQADGLQQTYLLGGGYKYCQMGEGNCFLRAPKDTQLRPIITGWFSEMSTLGEKKNYASGAPVIYGEGAYRFYGSTLEPTSFYRAQAVFDFFKSQSMSPQKLRALSQKQLAMCVKEFDQYDFNPKTISRDSNLKLDDIGGFLTLHTPYASPLMKDLHKNHIFCDHRGPFLRFGTAPYVTDQQIVVAMKTLYESTQRLTL